MGEKFSIDDILAEYSDNSKKNNQKTDNNKKSQSASGSKIKQPIGPTMILRDVAQKQNERKKTEGTVEIPKEELKHLKGEVKARKVTHNNSEKTKSDESNTNSAESKTSPTEKKKADDYDDYKPSEPLFSVEQIRKVEAQRVAAHYEKLEESKTPKEKHEKKTAIKKESDIEKANPQRTEHKAKNVLKEKVSDKKSQPSKSKSVEKPKSEKAAVTEKVKKQDTIFGNIDDAENKTAKKEKSSVKIDTNRFGSLKERILQNRFLFEELTKRDFKKKYKRTFLGVLWSVVSPFFTFLIQLFVFGYIFQRNDSNYIIYILTGNLMFHFFSDATTTGMFSMYSNASVLSKINVPKSVFILSSNVASIFNFMLTLLVYFVFMIFCNMSFGPHLFLMIFPILCLIVFNIGISYILSALFVFFRDIQYLYSIATMLLMYMSAIFYYTDRFPDHLQFVFHINPVYRYISYMRQLVIDATVPSLSTHLVCLAFAVGALIIGYLFHKKTRKNFVYYY